MNQFAALTAVACSLGAPASGADYSLTKSTTKSLEAFERCFLAAEEGATNAWSFVPNEHGGVFSNEGAANVGNSYRLQLLDNGRTRTIRLVPANPTKAPMPPVAAAIDKCI
jgi:hypothetical protein